MIRDLVHYCYWEKDLNCARTTLTCLQKLYNIDIDGQIFAAAAGLHGAGGYRAQCGLVEGTLLFIGLHGHKLGKNEALIVKACYDFASGFEKKFDSLICRDLRPNGFTKNDPPHACEALTVKAIEYSNEFIATTGF